jgi:hypothetical protein
VIQGVRSEARLEEKIAAPGGTQAKLGVMNKILQSIFLKFIADLRPHTLK